MKSIIVLLFLVSCSAKPLSTSSSTNPQIEVETLFEHEGCKVYKFYDGNSQTVYYTNCNGRTQYEVSCGKGCTKDIQVSTSGAP